MKKIFNGTILCNEEIAKNIYKMKIEADFEEKPRAGQFVNIYLNDKSLLLPRPISICDIHESGIIVVYGVVGGGTKQLSTYEVGVAIKVSSPLGNGYFLEGTAFGGAVDDYRDKKVVLAAGGIGVPPMVLLAKTLKQQGAEVIASVGFKDEPFLIDELKACCDDVFVATDSGACGFHGNAVQMIQENGLTADEYFSCGPKVMLKALSRFCAEQGVPCQVSLEERMGCGYGACVGCTCKIKVKTENGVEIQQKGVCKHGPVFFGEEVAWNE